MVIDILFAVIILIAIIKGYNNGFIVAIFSVIALLVGLAAAVKLSAVVAAYLKGSVNISTKWLPAIAFLVVFAAVVLLVRIGAAALQKTFELVMLGWLNKLAGIVLYSFMYTVIFSVILFYSDRIHLLKAESISQSNTYPFIKPLGPKAIDSLSWILPFFKNMFHDLEAFFGTVATQKM